MTKLKVCGQRFNFVIEKLFFFISTHGFNWHVFTFASPTNLKGNQQKQKAGFPLEEPIFAVFISESLEPFWEMLMIRDIVRDSCDGCSPPSPSSEDVDAFDRDVKMKASCSRRWYFPWSDCGKKLGPLWTTHTRASSRLFRWRTNTTLYWTVSLISVGYAWHFLTSLGLFSFVNGIKKKVGIIVV